jgi:hypothetical protein
MRGVPDEAHRAARCEIQGGVPGQQTSMYAVSHQSLDHLNSQPLSCLRNLLLITPNAGQPFLGSRVHDFLALAYFSVPALRRAPGSRGWEYTKYL